MTRATSATTFQRPSTFGFATNFPSQRNLTAEHLGRLDSMLGAADGAICLPGGFRAERKGDLLAFGKAPSADLPAPTAPVAVACPGRTRLDPGGEIDCTEEPFDEAAFRNHCLSRPEGVELLDADRIAGPLICRERLPGDAFHPLGAPGAKSVSDFLTDSRLPADRRRSVRCICDDSGIVYLAPLRIAERVKVTGGTRRVLRVAFQRG